MAYVAIAILALLGLWYRYVTGVDNACRFVAAEVVGAHTDPKIKEAVTRPFIKRLAALVVILAIVAAAVLAFRFSLTDALFGVTAFYIVGLIAGATFWSKPDERVFLLSVYGYLERQLNRFRVRGEDEREKLTTSIVSKIEQRYGALLQNQV